MKPREFVVKIERTDMNGIDPVHVRAWSRRDAEEFVKRMYKGRLKRIVR